MDAFPKPPGLGIWLVLVIGADAVALTIIGPKFEFAASIVLLVCLAVAAWVVLAWLARWIGYASAATTKEFAAGYRESRETGRMPVWHEGDAP